MRLNLKWVLGAAIAFACLTIFGLPQAGYASEYEDDYGYTYCNHEWEDDYVIKEATLKSRGVARCTCWNCLESRDRTFAWKLGEPESEYYKSYNIWYNSTVYRNSKSITVYLDNAVKGSVVKVKIGKKTYKKKVGYKKKVKIKIKQPKKYGTRINIKVYYHGRLIGKLYDYDDDYDWYWCYDNVYYGKKIKKGMTKKQVKWLSMWGSPDRTASSSGGWSYWYYDDGSYIGFKSGRVQYWYYVP